MKFQVNDWEKKLSNCQWRDKSVISLKNKL